METTLTQACIASSSSVPVHYGLPYALGPIDEPSLMPVAMQSAGEVGFVLWVPEIAASLSSSSELRQGAMFGYECGAETLQTPPQVVNMVARDFLGDLRLGRVYLWTVGFILGYLAALAEDDRLLALVGIAHLCFLLARVPAVAGPELKRAVLRAECLHNVVVQSYRGTVQALKAGGMRIEEAWKAALVPNTGQMASHAREVRA